MELICTYIITYPASIVKRKPKTTETIFAHLVWLFRRQPAVREGWYFPYSYFLLFPVCFLLNYLSLSRRYVFHASKSNRMLVTAEITEQIISM